MEILDYREINKGCLKSAFKLKMPIYSKTGQKIGHTLTECTYFEKDNGNFWINAASKEYMTKEGQKKSHNMHAWDEELMKIINRAVRDKIKSGQYEKKVEKAQNSYAAVQMSFDDSECPF